MMKKKQSSTERSVWLAAVAVGLGSVAVLAKLSYETRRPKIEVLSQRFDQKVPSKWGYGPGIVFAVNVTNVDDRPLSNYRFRLWDDEGGEMPIEFLYSKENEFFVPSGYAKSVNKPRLEVWRDENRLASTNLSPFPSPSKVLLPVSSRSSYRLKREAVQGEASVTNFFLEGPEPTNRQGFVRARILRTDQHPKLFSSANQALGYAVPVVYGSTVRSVEMEVKTYRRQSQSEELTVSIPIERHGEYVRAKVPKTCVVPNHLGLQVNLPKQNFEGHRLGNSLPQTLDMQFSIRDPKRSTSDQPDCELKVLSPRPESVGLRRISIDGSALSASKFSGSPPSIIRLVFRLTRTDEILLKRERLTLPVVDEPHLPIPTPPIPTRNVPPRTFSKGSRMLYDLGG